MPDGARHLPSVVIVGGGFCGAVCALHLLRDHPDTAVRLTVIEPRALLGAGLAYDTDDPQHRINVAAARMSPFAEDELHFDRWLRAEEVPLRDPAALLPDGRLYARRREVGRYIDALLRDAAHSHAGACFSHERQHALDARPDDGGYIVELADGSRRRADILVLAVGHPRPALPDALRPHAGDPRILADPWDAAALDRVPADTPALILGTGLTACDMVASLRARGQAAPLLAVSRHGLLPRARTRQPVEPEGDFSTEPEHSARRLLRRVRRVVAASHAAGRPWENAIDALRRQGREVWTALPPAERLRFLRHLRAFWDAHRYQSAPQIAELLARETACGTLEVLAATLLRLEPAPRCLRAILGPRGAADGAVVERRVGAVIVCTGPGHAGVVRGNPVLSSLARRGALRADPYRLGIEVDARSRCLDGDGRPAASLFVAGPLARGTEGELMGLPQVSTQPRAVAGAVAAQLAQGAGAVP